MIDKNIENFMKPKTYGNVLHHKHIYLWPQQKERELITNPIILINKINYI